MVKEVNIESLLPLLRPCPLFAEFSDGELRKLIPGLMPAYCVVPRGDLAVGIDEPATRLFLVCFGLLAEQRSLESAHVHRFGDYYPGDLFGVEAYFSGSGQSHVEVLAIEDSTLLSFSPMPLLTDPCYAPRATAAMFRFLANNAVRNILRIDALCAPTVREKILTFFRAMRDKFQSDVFSVRMTRSQMAEFLSVSRGALIGELRRMEHDGLIRILPERRFQIMRWTPNPPGGRKEQDAAYALDG